MRKAVAICSAGPSATNFITGLYTAFIDAMPVFCAVGQANTNQLNQGPFQCVDNVQNAKFDFDIDDYIPREILVVAPDLNKIKEATKMLRESKSPVIIMGGSCFISKCTEQVVELAEILEISVIIT